MDAIGYRRADLPPSPEARRGRVRPLRFASDGRGGMFQTETGPRYKIGPIMPWGRCRAYFGSTPLTRDGFPSQADAEAAANDHHTARILRALGVEVK